MGMTTPTFEQIHLFMTEPIMLWSIIGIFAIGIVLFIIFGAMLGTPRTTTKKGKPVIVQKNFRRLMSVIVIMGMLLALTIYPYHLFFFTDIVMDTFMKDRLWEFIITEVVLVVFLILLNIKYKK